PAAGAVGLDAAEDGGAGESRAAGALDQRRVERFALAAVALVQVDAQAARLALQLHRLFFSPALYFSTWTASRVTNPSLTISSSDRSSAAIRFAESTTSITIGRSEERWKRCGVWMRLVAP